MASLSKAMQHRIDAVAPPPEPAAPPKKAKAQIITPTEKLVLWMRAEMKTANQTANAAIRSEQLAKKRGEDPGASSSYYRARANALEDALRKLKEWEEADA